MLDKVVLTLAVLVILGVSFVEGQGGFFFFSGQFMDDFLQKQHPNECY